MERKTCKHCGETKLINAVNWTWNSSKWGHDFNLSCCRKCWNAREKARRDKARAAFIGPRRPNGWGGISGLAHQARWANHKKKEDA